MKKKSFWCNFGLHTYKVVDSKACKAEVGSVLNGYMGKYPARAQIELCTSCGKMRGAVVCWGTVERISLEELAVRGYFNVEGRLFNYGELLAISRLKRRLI